MSSKITNKKSIIEGVYGLWTRKPIKKADLVIWLDPPFRVLSHRIFLRYLKRKLKGSSEDTLKGTLELIKYAGRYKKTDSESTSSYNGHKALIQRHDVKFILIRNKKDLNKLFQSLI